MPGRCPVNIRPGPLAMTRTLWRNWFCKGSKPPQLRPTPFMNWKAQAGEYSVILNARKEAVCVIRTEKVMICPFSQVGEEQAWKEGEGDRSLEYWRSVHRKFFTEELQAVGLAFNEEMPVVCEEFVRVFP